MKSVRIVAIVFSLLLTIAGVSAQTRLDSLRPQPRQAYVRLMFSAVYSPSPVHPIFLDPTNPAWGIAADINARLRGLGLNTLPVALWSDADSTASGIFIGTAGPFLRRHLDAVPDQKIVVTPTYPGPEGYVLDVTPMRALIVGSDSAGLWYGADTFLQLLAASPSRWLHACRIVDAPEFPIRWLYYSTNVQVGANITKAKQVWTDAYRNRLNGVHLSDSKFSRPTTLPNFYFDSLRSLLRWSADRRLSIIPGVMPFGYSESMLYHDPNLAAGVPVVRQPYVQFPGDTTASLLGRIPPMPNGDFEQLSGSDIIPGFTFIDQPGKISYVDLAVKHGGKASVRFEKFATYDPQYGHGRIALRRKVPPFAQFRLSGWVRTEGLQPANCITMTAIGNKNSTLLFTDISLPSSTGDWRKLEFTFNSLESDTVTVYWGVWDAKGGKIWWDDLSFDETGLVNLIRRQGAPLKVEDKSSARVYSEGSDFDTLRDAGMGRNPWPGSYDTYHTPPRIRPRNMSSDTFYVSYYHATVIYGGQVMMTPSEPVVYDILDREFRALDTVMRAETYFMQHDEIRTLNWDLGDQSRGLTPGQLLAENVSRCRDIIRRARPNADLWIWSDMFDEFHNAVRRNYYLVNGDLRGSADLLPKDIGIVNWNGREGIVQKSLDFFASRGFRQISAPFYDGDENDIRIWKEWMRGVPNTRGMMYTTWRANYGYLKPFGEYAWNHAPYIEHCPPTTLQGGGVLDLYIRITGDPWDAAWSAGTAAVRWRTRPGDPFAALPFTPTPGILQTVPLMVPAQTRWLQWFVEASDNRGWSTKVPFGDTVFFELGEIPTGSESVDLVRELEIFGVYPNPGANAPQATLDFRAPAGRIVDIEIVDVRGSVRSRSKISAVGGVQSVKLPLHDLPRGVYIVSVHAGGIVRRLRLIR